jgi:MoaA/NifB/PqqE/SkfB family radical SAM enzyme
MTKLTPLPTAQREDLGDDGLAPLLPRRDLISALPILTLYPHNRCNCRCVMCDIWRIAPKEEIAAEDLGRWLPEWRALGVRRVVLSGGEPLMHSHLWEICKRLRESDVGVTILTTGLLLRREAERLVQYCDDVVLSLDGPREVHNHIRNVPRAYEKLAQGVAAVKAAGPDTRVSGRCTIQAKNFKHMRATVAAARELSLDTISFLAADVSTEAFNRPGGWSAERVGQVALAEDDLPLLAAELDALERECAEDFASGYISESPTKLRRRLQQYYAALNGRGVFHPVDCNAPWVSAVIETDGTVRPCFFQPPLGNLHELGSLAAVLNSPEAIMWRQGLDTHRDTICQKCVCSLSLRRSDLAEGATDDLIEGAAEQR